VRTVTVVVKSVAADVMGVFNDFVVCRQVEERRSTCCINNGTECVLAREKEVGVTAMALLPTITVLV